MMDPTLATVARRAVGMTRRGSLVALGNAGAPSRPPARIRIDASDASCGRYPPVTGRW